MADGPGAALSSLTPDHCIGLYPALVVGWRPGTGPKTKPAPTGAGQRGQPWCPEQRVHTQGGGVSRGPPRGGRLPADPLSALLLLGLVLI